MPIQVTIGYGFRPKWRQRNIRYTLDGSEPTPDNFIFVSPNRATRFISIMA
ncbi:MAG: hypothetical protein R2911_37355 [Caldilineaceae bacterium]